MKTFNEFVNEYKYGVYYAVKLSEDSKEKILEYQHNNINTEINTDLHCTLIYSSKSHNNVKNPLKSKEYEVLAKPVKFELFGPNKDILALQLKSTELEKRHQELMKEYDFTYDFDKYIPHITLSYDVPKNFDLSTLPEIDFDITLTNEYFEKLDENKYDEKTN